MGNKIVIEYLDEVPPRKNRPFGFWEKVIRDFLESGKPAARVMTETVTECNQYIYGLKMCARRKGLPVRVYRKKREVFMERVSK